MDTIAPIDSPLRIVELSGTRLDDRTDPISLRAALLRDARLQLSYDLDRG